MIWAPVKLAGMKVKEPGLEGTMKAMYDKVFLDCRGHSQLEKAEGEATKVGLDRGGV